MKRYAKPIFKVFVPCLLAFPMTACPSPGGEGEGEGEGEGNPDVTTFILPGGVALEMVNISAGTFMMGSTNGYSDEEPVHQVTLTQDFQIGQFEITKAQWEALMGTAPRSAYDCDLDDPNSPAVLVSWNDAQAFIMALSDRTHDTFRLPTEAEWEYACRAGTTTEYSFGDDVRNLGANAWYEDNTNDAHTVGQKLPNAFGLFDMHGNVEELCNDWYSSRYYSSVPGRDPTGPTSGSSLVYRGGSYRDDLNDCRSASRGGVGPDFSNCNIGFRVVRVLPTR